MGSIMFREWISRAGKYKENAIEKLKESIGSFGDVCKEASEVYTAPLSTRELHEFLTVEGKI